MLLSQSPGKRTAASENNSRRHGRPPESPTGDRPAQLAHFHFASGFSSPLDSRTCWTPWSVFQDGSGGLPIPCTPRETALRRPPGSDRRPGPSEPQPVITRIVRSWLPVQHGPGGPRSNGSRRPTRGRSKPAGAPEARAWPRLLQFTPGPLSVIHMKRHPPPKTYELNPLVRPSWFHPFMLLTVSRPFELSLQSPFQLSLTVLVLYRTRGCI